MKMQTPRRTSTSLVRKLTAQKGPLARANARAGLQLVSPSVLIVLALVVVPIVWTIVLAFQDVPLMQLRHTGLFGNYTLDNFLAVFTSPGLWHSLLTTVIYSVLGTGGAILIGLVAALALRKPFRGRTFVRAAILLPFVAPVVAVTFAWKTMLNPEYGILNAWGAKFLGWDEPIAFLSQRSLETNILGVTLDIPIALASVIAFEMWRTFPFAFLFLTARLQALPDSIEEAARVDGATPLQTFRHIVLPQLTATIAVLTVLRFIWTFNAFDEVYLLTNGQAGTEVVSVRVFNLLINRGDVGAAAAQALFLAAVLAIFILLYGRLIGTKRDV
ncbi:carbohydrate ABC transporter permease [Parasphingorhabdus pacifica]